MQYRLTIVSGALSGQSMKIYSERFVIGREGTCDIVIDDPFVSGFQCMLLEGGNTLHIQDLGSKNGTYVNGRRIESSTVPVNVSDIISIGGITLRVESADVDLDSDTQARDSTDVDVNAPKKEQAESDTRAAQ